jgi:hypothetical protein
MIPKILKDNQNFSHYRLILFKINLIIELLSYRTEIRKDQKSLRLYVLG